MKVAFLAVVLVVCLAGVDCTRVLQQATAPSYASVADALAAAANAPTLSTLLAAVKVSALPCDRRVAGNAPP